MLAGEHKARNPAAFPMQAALYLHWDMPSSGTDTAQIYKPAAGFAHIRQECNVQIIFTSQREPRRGQNFLLVHSRLLQKERIESL